MTADIAAALKGTIALAEETQLSPGPFLKFDGEGDTANARERAIGGHPAVLLRGVCRRKEPGSPPRRRGRLRSLWEARELRGRAQRWLHQLVALGRRKHHGDGKRQSERALHLCKIARHRRGRAGGRGGKAPSRAGLYWNAACLRDIGAPRFWGKETLEPILARWRTAHPPRRHSRQPVCREP